MDNKKQVIEALADWIIHVVNKKDLATPEEIAALPKVAEVFFGNCTLVKGCVDVATADSVDSKELVKRLEEISKSNVRRSF